MEAMTAAKVTVVLEEDLDGGPADETLRYGLGGTAYTIVLSDRSRIPASIVRQCQAATGGRCRRPGASLARTNPRRPVNDAR